MVDPSRSRMERQTEHAPQEQPERTSYMEMVCEALRTLGLPHCEALLTLGLLHCTNRPTR